MIETTPLNHIQLRKFGVTLMLGMMAIFGLIAPMFLNKKIPLWPFLLSSLILIPTLIQPMWLKWIYTPWMKIGAILGWINTRIILGVIYFACITPIGMFMRLCGKDTMQKHYDRQATTYRKISSQPPISHMEKPFS